MASKKAARVKKRGLAHERAADTDQWTEILFRALSSRVANRWRFVSFRGVGGREWRGIVDLLAIRKDTSRPLQRVLNSGDLFDMVLVQMKGGSARPPGEADIARLQAVGKHYRAKAIVLFSWKKGHYCRFHTLARNGKWTDSSALEIFG